MRRSFGDSLETSFVDDPGGAAGLILSGTLSTTEFTETVEKGLEPAPPGPERALEECASYSPLAPRRKLWKRRASSMRPVWIRWHPAHRLRRRLVRRWCASFRPIQGRMSAC